MTTSVSVVVPCYNAETFVVQAIQSALNQTAPPDEILVVDDGSRDRSADLVRSLNSPLIRLIQQENRGESVARNRGIEAARGRWIAFLDADDLWERSKLERQLAVLSRPGHEEPICVHTGYYNFGVVNEVPPIPDSLLHGDYSVEDLICTPFIKTSSVLVRADTGVRFPEWTVRGEDTLYFAELSLHGTFAYVPDLLVGYRRSSIQQTQEVDHVTESHASLLRWLDMHRSDIGEAARSRIEQRLLADLFERLANHKWYRDWPRYWKMRRYLQSFAGVAHPLLNERIYPRLAYRVKDWMDSLSQRSRPQPQR